MTAKASRSTDGQAFCGRTCIPVRTGSRQVRTLGVPSTFIKQLGHLPEKHSAPRGRWYLKLRLKMRTPAAWRAEAMVSPTQAMISRPAKEKVTFRVGSISCVGEGGSLRVSIRMYAWRGEKSYFAL